MALVLGAGLAAYFSGRYLTPRDFNPPIPSTVLRATHFMGSWPWARFAWVIAIVLGLVLAVGALVRDRRGYARGAVVSAAAAAFYSALAATHVRRLKAH